MRSEDFTKQSPGKLERTAFTERFWEKGLPQSRQVEGVAFVPHPLPPNLDRPRLLDRLYPMLEIALRNLGVLDGVSRNLRNPHLLIGPFVRREAVLSSKIENTHASAQQLALFEFEPGAVRERDEVGEVFNYVRALEHGLRSDLPVCLRLVRELHSILLSDVARYRGTAGAFRTSQNAIGRDGARFSEMKFVPPPPSRLHDCLNHFERYVNTPDGLPPLVRMALVHYQFEAIHPFDDGNGRVGRLLIPLMLCGGSHLQKPLVYVSAFFEEHRERYADLLYRVSTEGCWEEWIEFFVSAVSTQAADALTRAEELAALRERYRALVKEKRASGLLPAIIDELFVRPSITSARVQQLNGVNPPSANAALERLVSKGIVAEVTGRKRNRVFVAPEILGVIERPSGSDANAHTTRP